MTRRSSLDDPDVEPEPEPQEPQPQILVRTRKDNIVTTTPFDKNTRIDFIFPDGYTGSLTLSAKGELHISANRYVAIEPRSSKYIVIKPT